MSTEKKITLSPEIQTLSDKILKDISFDKETGVGSVGEKDLFKENLPEGLSIENVKDVNNYTRTFVAATVHAAGMVGIQAMASNKKLDQVSITVPLEGRDKVEAVFKRSEEFNNPMKGTTGTHYGNPHVKVAMRAGDKGTALSNAFKAVREAAAAKLA